MSIDVELIEGSGGIFDVRADGDLIYSRKQQDGRFPEHNEVLEALKQRV